MTAGRDNGARGVRVVSLLLMRLGTVVVWIRVRGRNPCPRHTVSRLAKSVKIDAAPLVRRALALLRHNVLVDRRLAV